MARLELLAHILVHGDRAAGQRRHRPRRDVGLIPVIGDVVTTAISSYIVWEARRLGAPRWLIARGWRRTWRSTAWSAVPLVGDLFDAAFKANRRNVVLLRRHLERSGSLKPMRDRRHRDADRMIPPRPTVTARPGDARMNQRPRTPELDAIPVTSTAAAPVILPLQVLPDTAGCRAATGGAWRTSRRNGAAMVVRAVLPDLRPEPVRRVHRQRPADRRSYKGRDPVSDRGRLSGGKFGGFLARTDYRDPVIGKEIAEHGWACGRRSGSVQHPQPRHAGAGPGPADWRLSDAQCRSTAEKTGGTTCQRHRVELARHRRPGPRRRRPAALRLPPLGDCWSHPGAGLVGHRRAGRGGAGLFRRLGRPGVPEGDRDLDRDPVALSPDHHLGDHHAELLVLLGILLLFSGCRSSALVRAEFCGRATSSTCAPPARSGSRTPANVPATSCPTPWWRR